MDDIREIINHAGWTTLLSSTNGDWIAKRGWLTGITVVDDKQAELPRTTRDMESF